MFLIEGLIVTVVGIAAFFMMAPSPSETRTRWRPNGYFTDRDVDVIVNRVIRDDPTKSSMHNREGLTLSLLWKAFKDYDLWPLYFVGLTFGLAGYPLSFYFQISMRRLGFSTLMANLLSIPHSFLTMFNLVVITFASEAYNNRWLISSIENWWFLPFFIALRAVSADITPWGYFAIATLVLGYPYVSLNNISSENTADEKQDRSMPFKSVGCPATQAPCAREPSPRHYTTCSCKLVVRSALIYTKQTTHLTTTKQTAQSSLSFSSISSSSIPARRSTTSDETPARPRSGTP